MTARYWEKSIVVGWPARELETRWASLCRFRKACNEEIELFPSPRLEYMRAKSCVRKEYSETCQHIVLGAAHHRDGGCFLRHKFNSFNIE